MVLYCGLNMTKFITMTADQDTNEILKECWVNYQSTSHQAVQYLLQKIALYHIPENAENFIELLAKIKRLEAIQKEIVEFLQTWK